MLQEQTGTYKGNFQEGTKHGEGTYHFRSNLVYEGGYIQGLKSGNGVILNSDESPCYRGEFKGGLPDGFGEAFIDGKAVKGEFKRGILK